MNISSRGDSQQYISNKYDQSTIGRTRSWCKQLKKTGNVENLLKKIKDDYFWEPFEQNESVSLAERQIVTLKEAYTDENINKEVSAHNVTKIKRSKDSEDKKLYKESLDIVENYLEKNENLEEEKQFFLYLFKAKLASHLNNQGLAQENYSKAQPILQKAIDDNVSWIQNIDYELLNDIIEKGKIKHERLQLTPLLVEIKPPCTPKDILLSKTYLDPSANNDMIFVATQTSHPLYDPLNPSVFSNKIFDDVFQSLESTKFSKLVGQMNALDALEHPRFNILLNKFKRGEHSNVNSRNTVRLSINAFDDSKFIQTKQHLFHELTHRAIFRIFNNKMNPYFKDDQVAQKAYRDSMKKVLMNIIRMAAVQEIPSNLETLELNELVELCFGRKPIISTSKMPSDVYNLFEKMGYVFGRAYTVGQLDTEWITNVSDCITILAEDSKCFEIIKPLMDYVDEYVTPELEKYIEGHPRRDQLLD